MAGGRQPVSGSGVHGVSSTWEGRDVSGETRLVGGGSGTREMEGCMAVVT